MNNEPAKDSVLKTECPNCKKQFEVTSHQKKAALKKYGKAYCTRACQEKSKPSRYKSVRQVREFTCGQCAKKFKTASGGTYGQSKKGNRVYCSPKCKAKWNNNAAKTRGPLMGPCLTCNEMFRSVRKEKKFCSMDCYTASDDFKARITKMNKIHQVNRLKEAGIEFDSDGNAMIPKRKCPNCQCEFEVKKPSSTQKYCNNDCRREYYENRFDRWIANPEKLALPQNFDEFMCKEKLPCLVEGCDWEGENLGMHVNFAHGITAELFKELAGFNHKTGLVVKELRQKLRERMLKLIGEGKISTATSFPVAEPGSERKQRPMRLEGKEHYKKARAITESEGPRRPPVPCRQCGEPVVQPVFGSKDYCSTPCRTKYYKTKDSIPLACDYCGEEFMANREQQRRRKKQQLICCSSECRNRMNITKCLSQTGKSKPFFGSE